MNLCIIESTFLQSYIEFVICSSYQFLPITNWKRIIFDTIPLYWIKDKYRYCLNKGNILDFDEAFSFSGAPFDEKGRHFGR